MIFLVERVTPGKPPLIPLERHDGAAFVSRQALPFEVEIEDVPEARTAGYLSECECTEVFRLTFSAMRNLNKRGMIDARRKLRDNVCVCVCMGKVI